MPKFIFSKSSACIFHGAGFIYFFQNFPNFFDQVYGLGLRVKVYISGLGLGFRLRFWA